jgi:catalase
MGTSAGEDRGHPESSMRHLDQLLDEALDATYPASDPVAITEDDRAVMVAAPSHPPLGALAAIGVIIAACVLAFAYTARWLTPQPLTPARMVDALSRRGGDPLGHRRNHAKGICFTGDFEANGAGAALSTAPMLARGRYPVIGRFAIATGDPQASDASARVRSMAIRIAAPDREEWRSGMNNSPVFAVSTPKAFYEMTRAQEIDPLTHKPDPLASARFSSSHPESRPFAAWAKSAPWTSSYADQLYNSLNAFYFVDSTGRSHLVRWSMQPTVPANPVPQSSLLALGRDFLDGDLAERLARGPLRWHLIVTVAEPSDPSSNATLAWPADRRRLDVGTLVVQRAQRESDGACRDYNYDPTILPVGIRPSPDPLLAARSSAYARSFDLREAQAAAFPRSHAAQ